MNTPKSVLLHVLTAGQDDRFFIDLLASQGIKVVAMVDGDEFDETPQQLDGTERVDANAGIAANQEVYSPVLYDF